MRAAGGFESGRVVLSIEEGVVPQRVGAQLGVVVERAEGQRCATAPAAEFVQSQWINDGVFFGAGTDKDPIVGSNEVSFTLPRKPVRKRLQGIPNFVVTRGGEYCFMPGLRALRWLAELET